MTSQTSYAFKTQPNNVDLHYNYSTSQEKNTHITFNLSRSLRVDSWAHLQQAKQETFISLSFLFFLK